MNIFEAFKKYKKFEKIRKYFKTSPKIKDVEAAIDNIKADLEVLGNLCPDIKDDIKELLK